MNGLSRPHEQAGAAPRVAASSLIWLLTAVMGASALALWSSSVSDLSGLRSPLQIPWWALAMLFAGAEIFVIHLQLRRDAHSFSLSEVPLLLGLFFSSPGGLVAAQLIGAAAALAVHRRQSALKLAFNLSHFALGTQLAILAFHAVAPADPLGPAGWLGGLSAALISAGVGALAISAAVTLVERDPLRGLGHSLRLLAIVTSSNACLGLALVTVVWVHPQAAWLLVVPTVLSFLAYRAYTGQLEKHHSLQLLYESSRSLNRSLEVGPVVQTLLRQARDMFRAEIASITLFPRTEAESAVTTTLGPGDSFDYMVPVDLDPTEGVWARVASEGEALLLGRPINNERIRRYFARRGIRDAMVAPLLGDEGSIGVMLVGNRVGNVSTFDGEDLKLFETLANHASLSLRNARLVERLEESLVHLTEMNRVKDDFVSSVSHELRTPLTSILGYVKTLLRPNVRIDASEQRDFLTTIERQADRLKRLIEDLLVVSRLETRQVVPVESTISLPHLARRVAEEARERGTHLVEVEFEQGMPLVRTDERKVRQILAGLLDNALKYSPPGSRVVVSGKRQSDGVLVSVSDEGPGIPEQLRERIFDRFYQIDQSTTRPAGGTGLGLYIARRLAEVVGGRLWLERSSRSGSVFCLWIPTASPPGPSRQTGAVPPDSEARSASS